MTPAFTNVAGRVIYATPEYVTNNIVRFNGRDIPLSVFLKTEQRRIRLACNACELPSALNAKFDFYKNAICRINALKKAGQMSAAEAERQRGTILEAWESDLNSSLEISKEEVRWWRTRL